MKSKLSLLLTYLGICLSIALLTHLKEAATYRNGEGYKMTDLSGLFVITIISFVYPIYAFKKIEREDRISFFAIYIPTVFFTFYLCTLILWK